MKDWKTSFSVPIYDHKLILVVTDDMKSWADKYPDPVSMTQNGECLAFFAPAKPKVELIVIQPRSPLNHIAHEIGHAARYIMGYIGFKIMSDNDEPLAYLEDFLTREIHNRLKKITVDKKKK